MLIPDSIRKCVAFVGCRTNRGTVWGGTVFFTAMTLPNEPDNIVIYAVTAKHVIVGIGQSAVDDKVHIRVNLKNGGVHVSENKIDDWLFHPDDPYSDVAVLPVNVNTGADVLAYPIEKFALQETIDRERIGIGDETFLAGLFSLHRGKKRNVPVVRVGNISAMPEEPIEAKWGDTTVLMDAYLVECRSIGGLSGSPVFVHLGVMRFPKVESPTADKPYSKFYLLGLMRGHWELPSATDDDPILDDTVRKSINAGMAIVVPAQKILEVLNQPKLVTMRKDIENEIKMRRASTPDSSA